MTAEQMAIRHDALRIAAGQITDQGDGLADRTIALADRYADYIRHGTLTAPSIPVRNSA